MQDEEIVDTKSQEVNEAPEIRTSEVFVVQDRVVRLSGRGCQGSVLEVREELVSPSSNHDRDLLPMIKVEWDNGTVSYLAPDALTKSA